MVAEYYFPIYQFLIKSGYLYAQKLKEIESEALDDEQRSEVISL